MQPIRRAPLAWALAAAFVFGIVAPLAAEAAPAKLTGWAWSAGIGWVHFRGTAQSGGEYGAWLDMATGDVSGYAWSPIAGWLSFERQTSGDPPKDDIGAGAGPIARMNASGVWEGWARFLTACADVPCTALRSDVGNWDGWVRFSGPVPPKPPTPPSDVYSYFYEFNVHEPSNPPGVFACSCDLTGNEWDCPTRFLAAAGDPAECSDHWSDTSGNPPPCRPWMYFDTYPPDTCEAYQDRFLRNNNRWAMYDKTKTLVSHDPGDPGSPGGEYKVERDAANPNDFRGWAWGDSVAWWLSVNSKNCDADADGRSDGAQFCPAAGTVVAPYKVAIGSAVGFGVTLDANPSSGRRPLNDVDLIAVVRNATGGSITYTFDCGNGEPTLTDTTLDTTYRAQDFCDYHISGTYTATVEARNDDTGDTATASQRIDIFTYGEVRPE